MTYCKYRCVYSKQRNKHIIQHSHIFPFVPVGLFAHGRPQVPIDEEGLPEADVFGHSQGRNGLDGPSNDVNPIFMWLIGILNYIILDY